MRDISTVMQAALAAFEHYRQTSFEARAIFLETIADHIELLASSLISQAHEETNLPEARLIAERGRTIGQFRMFARMLREGSFVEASIDTAMPGKIPSRPDVRKMLLPLGPVVVFGASNFPFAYSTAGGDTASALAAGCPVVVKAHPAHLKTSVLVASAIEQAVQSTGMPIDVFQHVTDTSFDTGKQLVQDERTSAVGFTGSFAGGRALYDYATARKNLIPVFSEMGSVNPVIILPGALKERASIIATQYTDSITLGMGQFCTNPGILLTVHHDGLDTFISVLQEEFKKIVPVPMLHAGIHAAYQQKTDDVLREKEVALLATSAVPAKEIEPTPMMARVSGNHFLQQPGLQEEIFGPYSLLVVCEGIEELRQCWLSLQGQLTTSLMGTEQDFHDHPWVVTTATQIAGRVVYNGVPTGVEVCASMVHGGLYPATTDSRFTAVGIDAVKRWMRPVCFQNCPSHLLPVALQDDNPLKIFRRVNDQWVR